MSDKGKTLASFMALVLSLLLGGGCSETRAEEKQAKERTGGGCKYAEYPGTCTIVAIGEPPESHYKCKRDPKMVTFDFVPTDPTAPQKHKHTYLSDKGASWTISAGAHPPASCFAEVGIKVGAAFPCKRLDATAGTCTPAFFRFDDKKMEEACVKQCF